MRKKSLLLTGLILLIIASCSKDDKMAQPKQDNENGSEKEGFYLAENGITVGCPLADFGDTGTVNGIIYTKRHANEITSANASTTCTSGITSMHRLFSNDPDFNADISSWDVSHVVDMSIMFGGDTSFNQNIGAWDVSNVANMGGMFSGAYSFNQDIGQWNVGKVTDMGGMFAGALSFNQDLSGWCVQHIPKEPFLFSYLPDAFKPKWGTCPG